MCIEGEVQTMCWYKRKLKDQIAIGNMAGRKIFRRAGSLRTAIGMVSIPEEPRTPGTLRPILKRTREDRPMETPSSEASLTETVVRMMEREKTFLTQMDDEQPDSRENSDFDSDDDYDYDYDYDSDDLSDVDENQNRDVRRRGRRKRRVFDIDKDFDFDADDEAEIRRRSKKKKITTEVVYAKACEKCRLHPCGAFKEQMSKVDVSLRGMHLGPTEVKPIAISLVKDRSIVGLDISQNNMGPIGFMYLAEMMQANTYLMELNLSATNPGKAGLSAIAETLRLNNSLKILKLEGNHIEPPEAPHIATIILSCPRLKELHLGHNRLGANGGKVIAEALIKSTGLLSLDLQWNHLRRESAVEISKALARNKSLKVLNVAWNGFGREGCLALSKSLGNNTFLLELDLTCNRIDYQALSFLAHGLCNNTTLQTVKLGHNPMTTDGAKQLLKAIGESKTSEIKELDLEDVPVDGDFMKMLKKYQYQKRFQVNHGYEMKLATSTRGRENDGLDLSKWDPVLVLFEYMRLDNLRLIDMFKSFDTKKRDKLSRRDLKAGINTLKLPFTEHALDEMMQKLDKNKDRMIDLEEMMKGSKEMSRYVNQRILKARAKKREDQGLIALRATLKNIIKKRKQDQDQAAQASRDRRKSLLTNVIKMMKPKKPKEEEVQEVVKEAVRKFLSLLKKRRALAAITEETSADTQEELEVGITPTT